MTGMRSEMPLLRQKVTKVVTDAGRRREKKGNNSKPVLQPGGVRVNMASLHRNKVTGRPVQFEWRRVEKQFLVRLKLQSPVVMFFHAAFSLQSVY